MSELTLKEFSENQTVTTENFDQFESALRGEIEKSLTEFKKLLHKKKHAQKRSLS